MNASIDDPLKPLDQVCKPDSRHAYMAVTLESSHAELSGCRLHDGVPRSVRQGFETAKNLSLYSWFVYRFHQQAEMAAFSSLEFALRIRAGFPEYPPEDIWVPSLSKLLLRAQKEGWITNDGFTHNRIPGMTAVDYLQSFVEAVPSLRNNLAHGSNTLHPNSRTTLHIIAQAINQLFAQKTT